MKMYNLSLLNKENEKRLDYRLALQALEFNPNNIDELIQSHKISAGSIGTKLHTMLLLGHRIGIIRLIRFYK